MDSPALRRLLLSELARRLQWGGLSYALFTGLFSTNLTGPARDRAVELTGLLALMGIARTLIAQRVIHRSEAARDGERLLQISALMSLIFGLFVAYEFWNVWGMAIPEGLLLVAVAGSSSFSANLFAPFPGLARFHACAQLLPVYIWAGFAIPRYGWLLAPIIVIHGLAIIQLTRINGGHTRAMFVDQLAMQEQSEDLRKARDAAEKAGAAKMSFLANMSHEIRTPLNGIMGLAEILRASTPTPEQSMLLSDIGRSGAHLMAILNDILDTAKVTSGKLTLEQAPFDLPLLIRDLVAPAMALAEARELKFQLELAPGLPQHVEGDLVRIRQVVSNLLTNAVKFTEAGNIRLEVKPAHAGWIRFDVSDTGIGLSAEQQAGLFQEFYQADSSTTRKFGGTGLGLSISRRLAELMGGRLWVESCLGEGSTFRFELPLPEAAPVGTIHRDASLVTRLPQGLRVLVAEDNAINRKVTGTIVSRAGAQVDIAVNGKEAVELHQANPYDVILMDCQMPELDGYQATVRIRSMDGAASLVPIIGVTANAFQEDKERCFSAGMNGYVAKPLTRQSLLEAIVAQVGAKPPSKEPVSATAEFSRR
jgi:signal transduction histidine kinase/ActR/RegA family two-component response regulator